MGYSAHQASQISAIFGGITAIVVAIFIISVILTLLFKRKTTININCEINANDMHNILKAVPGHVFNQRVKRVELLNLNAVGLFCSLVNIRITRKGEKWAYKSRLNGVLRAVYLGIVILCLVSGAISSPENLILLLIPLGIVWFIAKRTGKRIILSVEEQLNLGKSATSRSASEAPEQQPTSRREDSMFCINCGKPLIPNTKFCGSCGHNIVES